MIRPWAHWRTLAFKSSPVLAPSLGSLLVLYECGDVRVRNHTQTHIHIHTSTSHTACRVRTPHDFWTVLVELLVRLLVAFPTAARGF